MESGKNPWICACFIPVSGTEHLLEMLVANADPASEDIRQFSVEWVAAYRKNLLETPLPDADEILKKAAGEMNLYEEVKEFGIMEAEKVLHNVFWSLYGSGGSQRRRGGVLYGHPGGAGTWQGRTGGAGL